MKTLRQKLKFETRITPEPGFPALGNVHYLTYLEELHAKSKPAVYFEIGTESGASLRFSTGISIAVDPQFRLQEDVSRNKPELHMFQGTSDAFFDSKLVERLGVRIDLAFLDGMHLFEFLLRDFMNTERLMSPGGTILMHDCVPFNRVMAEREWNRQKTVSWTGDVWKLIPILREHRPDLKVEVLDLAPTGLVRVTGLDPANRVLAERYEAIVAEYAALDLDGFGLERFAKAVDIKPNALTKAAWPRRNIGSKQIRQVAIRTSIPSADVAHTWGDHWFVSGLKEAFETLGMPCHIDMMTDWDNDHGGDCLDLFIFGHDHFPPHAGRPCFAWCIYPGKRYDESSLNDYDHLFVASATLAGRLRRRLRPDAISYLPQAFDPSRFRPGHRRPKRSDNCVFVANAHFRRTDGIAARARDSGAPLKIWGAEWPEPFAGHVVANYLPNDEVPDVYRNALAVLCDHHPQMRVKGFVSNRIFDALAVGAPVISDDVAGLPPDFAPFVHCVRNQDEFDRALADVRAETAEDKARRLAFAREMPEHHSFTVRAAEILETARSMGHKVIGRQATQKKRV